MAPSIIIGSRGGYALSDPYCLSVRLSVCLCVDRPNPDAKYLEN